MTTVDQAFRSVVRAWPVMVRVTNMLERARSKGKRIDGMDVLLVEMGYLIRHWPSAPQLARAYHTVVEDEFGSQSYPESAQQVERWHTVAVNELNAELGITHCNGKDRHHLRVEQVDDLNRRRECIVCGLVTEVAVFEVGDWVWRKK